jgi:hypothetical protein
MESDMPTNIEFIYKTKHVIDLPDAGYTKAAPALPADKRLYVIYNDSTNRHVYIGTSTDVQKRFKPRIEALREFGFSKAMLDDVVMYIVQIKTNQAPTPPDDKGEIFAYGVIDVERLLVQTYIKQFNVSVRNVVKTEAFTNNTSQKIRWQLVNEGNLIVANAQFGVTWELNVGKSLT